MPEVTVPKAALTGTRPLTDVEPYQYMKEHAAEFCRLPSPLMDTLLLEQTPTDTLTVHEHVTDISRELDAKLAEALTVHQKQAILNIIESGSDLDAITYKMARLQLQADNVALEQQIVERQKAEVERKKAVKQAISTGTSSISHRELECAIATYQIILRLGEKDPTMPEYLKVSDINNKNGFMKVVKKV